MMSFRNATSRLSTWAMRSRTAATATAATTTSASRRFGSSRGVSGASSAAASLRGVGRNAPAFRTVQSSTADFSTVKRSLTRSLKVVSRSVWNPRQSDVAASAAATADVFSANTGSDCPLYGPLLYSSSCLKNPSTLSSTSTTMRALSTLSRKDQNIVDEASNKIMLSSPHTLINNLWQLLVASLAAVFLTTTSGLVYSLGWDTHAAPAAATATPSPPTRRATTTHPLANNNNNSSSSSPSVTKKSSVSFRPRRGSSSSSASPSYASVLEMNKQLTAEWEGKPYDVSVRAIRGSRFTMEDEYYVGNGGRLAAIFDGHGGSGVSQFLKKHLHSIWNECLQEKHWEERDDDHHLHPQHGARSSHLLQRPSVSCHVAALRATFNQLESDVLKDDDLEYQGSTAVAVVVHEGEDGSRTLLSANVGDSRAVLSRGKRAVDLTRDHKPNDEKEKARILAMGETIEWDQDCKVHRVRNLSLARAIGDRYAKPAVSSEVEIRHFPVVEDEDEFVVLASDGLWDVMSSQAVVSFVHDYMDAELSKMSKDNASSYKFVLRRNMAKLLAREAMRKGSSDNISVLVVWL